MLQAFHPAAKRDLLEPDASPQSAEERSPPSVLRSWARQKSTDGSAVARSPSSWVEELIDSRGREDGAVSMKVLQSLTLRLISATESWLDTFILKGGIDEIIELLSDWKGSPEKCNVVLRALLIAARRRASLDAIVGASGGVEAITFSFGRFPEGTIEVMEVSELCF